MTDKELNILANKVADIILTALQKKQDEWDQQFNISVEQETKELVLEEIYHWKGELKRAEEQEDYAKAALIHGKIKYLENKIKEL
tara:strand:+ start:1657 stop:1911 length:255 start_codon:yes stop_codon:yes gene_type:complete